MVINPVKILPVIMSGGAGTRLWPLSHDGAPKQFHALGGDLTMLQETVLRTSAPGFLPPLVIGSTRHGPLIGAQLEACGVVPAGVILEPMARNTAAVAVIASEWAKAHAPGARVLLMPADHIIADGDGFRALLQAAAAAAQDRIIVFGITPDRPETGYGYIKAGDVLRDDVSAVDRFVEKPDRATAEAYLAEGGYYWNAGIFLYDPEVFSREAEALAPEVYKAAVAALAGSPAAPGEALCLDAELFAACPSIPVDVAVMEKTGRAAVAPCDVGWVDIGSWSELWRMAEQDGDGNVGRGDVRTLGASGSLLWSTGPSISVIGLSDVMVIATPDHVLVLPKDRAQDVKKIVELRRS